MLVAGRWTPPAALRYLKDVEAHYHALMLLVLAGMAGFAVSGDLFDMFVFFEIGRRPDALVVAAFVLVITGGGFREPACWMFLLAALALVGLPPFGPGWARPSPRRQPPRRVVPGRGSRSSSCRRSREAPSWSSCWPRRVRCRPAASSSACCPRYRHRPPGARNCSPTPGAGPVGSARRGAAATAADGQP
ncbi:hypothetical protein JOL79_29320 [Microbispora sp. RL4-1S]|uniref:Uncharacterized protein n=1 Tax=Microbispora oryzae TaxID=2806554 RepID=A0A940WN04_9ACTN|nr:hypothetical protein [Microbispora oryzae]MBP2707888.1 hypothetical protein [Microbispora oryzae]